MGGKERSSLQKRGERPQGETERFLARTSLRASTGGEQLQAKVEEATTRKDDLFGAAAVFALLDSSAV